MYIPNYYLYALPDESRNLDGEQEICGILDQLALFLVGLASGLWVHHPGGEHVRVEADIELGFLGKKI